MAESTYTDPALSQSNPAMSLPDIPAMTDLVKSAGNVVESKLSSGELGTLWSTYQTRTLFFQMFGKFAQQTTDSRAKKLLDDYLAKAPVLINDIVQIFRKEQAALPIAFTKNDVLDNAPRLFDDEFHIMLLRMMAKATLGFNAINMSMSYRSDVRAFYEKSLDFSADVYNVTTDFLTNQGLLPRTPYVGMPTKTAFIEDTSYMSGMQFLGNKRALNTLEIAHIFSLIKENSLGLQLMAGFAQSAQDPDVRDYFNRGKDLAKKIVHDMGEVMIQCDVHPPAPFAGKATDSTVPIFSDRLMMSLTGILTSFGITGSSLGMAFSMRSDLPARLSKIIADTLAFAQEGGKLMIRHRWMEEPPQMEDRNAIIHSVQLQ